MKTTLSRNLILLLFVTLAVAAFAGCTSSSKVTLSSLSISPDKVAPGNPVTIAANILNSGKDTDYKAELKINNASIEAKKIHVGAGETRTIDFQYTPDSPGSYKADINGQTGTFDAVKPANFTAGQLNIVPESPVAGKELQASVQITNDGELAGSYTVSFRVNGQEVSSEEITLAPGQSATEIASYSPDTSGMFSIEYGGIKRSIKVLQPAEFKASSIKVTPSSIIAGESVNIEATIANSGEVADTLPVAMLVNGFESDSQTVSLEPGTKTSVNFSLTPDAPGIYNISIGGANASLLVTGLNKYTNESYFYTISYPPGFVIDDSATDSVAIEKSSTGGLSILVDPLSTSDSPQDYFDAIARGKKQQLPDWTYSSRTDVTENGVLVGYKFDYSNTVDGKKWVGKGMVLKKAGFGFYVVFTTFESEWEKNKAVAEICLNSFESPAIATGAYSNSTSGMALTLPAEWSVIESGDPDIPLYIYPPYDRGPILGQLVSELVAAGTTAQQYTDAVKEQLSIAGYSVSQQGLFIYNDGTTGYEVLLTHISGLNLRVISTINSTRAYSLVFYGLQSNVAALSSQINQLTKSLIISTPTVAGVNKNETLFLTEGEIPTLDPAKTEDSPGDIISTMFSGLVKVDADLKVVPDLAEKWDVSPDGKTYTFFLRKNAKFHDGRPVTAADVKYSWERACDPLVKAPKARYFLNDIAGTKDRLEGKASEISGIKVIDDYTLEVTIDAPKVYFLNKLTQPVTYVVDKSNVSKGSNWYEKPNGTGPFKLKSWDKNSLLVLERNDDYYSTPAKLKNIVFKLLAGYPVQLYESGEIDLAGVNLTDLDKVQDPANPLNKELLTGSRPISFYIGFNVAKPPFDDPKVRQAFALALDVPKIIEVTLRGQAEQAAGYVPQGIPGFNSSLQPLTTDVAKARQLITESKYGSVDSIAPITLYVPYGASPTDEAIVGMWQQNLGVQVKIETISSIENYLQRQRNDEFQVFTGGWGADYLDPQNFLEVLFQSKSPENSFAYSNSSVDSALAEAAGEADEARRLQVYQDLEKIILGDLPAIPLYRNIRSYVLVKPYVKGYQVTPIGVNLWCELYVEPH